MTRTLAFALAVALAGAAPATAQTASASSDCVPGAKPVVSAGLPKRPCANTTGVVVNRGPEVVPDPTPVAPVAAESEDATTTRRVIRRRDPLGYQASYAYPYPSAPSYSYGAGGSWGLVIQSDDVFLRYGNGYIRPDRPHRRHRGDRYRRHHPDYGRKDKPLIGVHRDFN